MLLKMIKMRWDELVLYLGVGLFGAVFGEIILALLAYMESEDPIKRVFRLGTIFAIVAMLFTQLLFGIFGLGQWFNYQVAFGVTRKKFICCDVLVSLIWSLATVLFAGVLYVAEGGLLKVFFAAYPENNILESLHLSPGMLVTVILLGLVCLTALKEMLGSLVMRFGNKAFWVIWAIWMLICILPARIQRMDEGNLLSKIFAGIARWISQVPAAAWGAAGIVFAVAAFAVTWIIIRKQAVAA